MKKLQSLLKYVISLSVGAVLLYYAFRNVDLSDFLARIEEVKYEWVVLSILLALASHWIRAYRWNMMLKPFGHNLSTGRTFLAVMTGYLANIAFPRLGEVTRCGVLKKIDNVSISTSFGTVVTERLIDFFILLSLIVLDFFIEFDLVFEFFFQTLGFNKINIDPLWIVLFFVVAIVVGIMSFIWVRRLLEKEHQHPTMNQVRIFLKDMLEGLLSLRKVENVYLYIFLTLAIWVLYYLMGYVLIFALPETSNLGMVAALTILAAGGIAMSAPVQAGVGTYHTFVSAVLVLYGISDQGGLFFATLMHATQIVFIVVFGGLSTLVTVFLKKRTAPEVVGQ